MMTPHGTADERWVSDYAADSERNERACEDKRASFADDTGSGQELMKQNHNSKWGLGRIAG